MRHGVTQHHVHEKVLYIAYTKNKEDCEMVCIPTESLILDDENEK